MLRRVWLKGLGWYPGDWVWPAALALVVAAAGAGGAVLLANRGSGGGTTFAATNAAAASPQTTAAATPGQAPGWPAGRPGWTVVLVSLPRTGGAEKAQQRAAKAAKTGLPDAGYLVSDRYASLHPGYYVVYAGIYGSRADAEAAVPTARAKGFGGAYARPVSG
jgi:SPOR domain